TGHRRDGRASRHGASQEEAFDLGTTNGAACVPNPCDALHGHAALPALAAAAARREATVYGRHSKTNTSAGLLEAAADGVRGGGQGLSRGELFALMLRNLPTRGSFGTIAWTMSKPQALPGATHCI